MLGFWQHNAPDPFQFVLFCFPALRREFTSLPEIVENKKNPKSGHQV